MTDNCACPALTAADPNTVAPFRNCTVPVAAAGVTVAVNVTACPNVDDAGFAVSTVVVAAALTLTVTTLDVLVAEFASPAYTALIEAVPTGNAVVESCACPPLNAAVPNEVAPLKNCTVPVTVEGVTVAVSVTACANAAEAGLAASVVVVATWLMVTATALDVLVAVVALPL